MTPILSALSARQEAILELLSRDLTHGAIAHHLRVTERTVRRDLWRARRALGVGSTAAAVAMYVRERAA